MHRRYFVDMDGTLVEWSADGDYTQKGYYATRPPITNMVNAVKQMLEEGKDVYTLSAAPVDDHSEADKNVSLDNLFGDLLPMERRIFVPYGQCKADYIMQFADSMNVLIDDFNDNLFSWNGVPIKFLNGINGGSNEWCGFVIQYDWQPAMIINQIERICSVY